jgi:AcrR family transcriptional regulator
VSSDFEPLELPLAGARAEERADAAANRCRILEAARALLDEQGFEGLTMDAVASAAGVGKGTVFRRFGDRTGLTDALMDDAVREFQDAFLSGPPPLGPGAPASERLDAFVVEFVRLQVRHMDTLMAAEAAPGRPAPRVIGMLLVHLDTLLEQIDAELDHQVLAGMILSAISAPVLYRMRLLLGATPEALERSALRLVRGPAPVASRTGAGPG